MGAGGAQAAVESAFREQWGRIVAALIRRTGDWDLAEECTQEAFAEALRRWPADGVPRQPGAWLTTVAGNRALDRLRRARRGAELLEQVGRDPSRIDEETMEIDEAIDESGIEDDRLRLIFTCCHPALALEGRVALTLRSLAGLTTGEIARAFLVSEATMAKRLTRAKAKIAGARIPYRVPPAHLLPERTGGVLAVLYLLFNEGYSASAGERLIRAPLCGEAIRLARLLTALMPDEPEAIGLLALMLLHHSRRQARLDREGEIATLEEQDRSAWDAAEIGEALALLDCALRRAGAGAGTYQLQAAIAACHA
ncbi:MAG: RNA polymerase sigma factor, partial [Solirubrobacteraceae bacterium]